MVREMLIVFNLSHLKLIFDNGRCIISHRGVSLTKTAHIVASIYANGRWHLSNLAHWKINNRWSTGCWRISKWRGFEKKFSANSQNVQSAMFAMR